MIAPITQSAWRQTRRKSVSTGGLLLVMGRHYAEPQPWGRWWLLRNPSPNVGVVLLCPAAQVKLSSQHWTRGWKEEKRSGKGSRKKLWQATKLLWEHFENIWLRYRRSLLLKGGLQGWWYTCPIRGARISSACSEARSLRHRISYKYF